jgi:transposase
MSPPARPDICPDLEGVESLFSDGRHRERDEGLAIQAELYQQIGRLNMEVEWLKKSCPLRLISSGP